MSKSLFRKEELARLRKRYAERGKEGKSRLLNEFCEQHGYERKHAIKMLGDKLGACRGQAPWEAVTQI